MTVQTNECNLCDAEFDIMHTEDSVIKYCPFCGEDLIKDSVEWCIVLLVNLMEENI